MGVGNAGFFQKTFFGEERYNGPGVAKHRTSLGESTDVCIKEVRCFCFPTRWKAWNTDIADLVEENGFDVLPLNHLPQHMG